MAWAEILLGPEGELDEEGELSRQRFTPETFRQLVRASQPRHLAGIAACQPCEARSSQRDFQALHLPVLQMQRLVVPVVLVIGSESKKMETLHSELVAAVARVWL